MQTPVQALVAPPHSVTDVLCALRTGQSAEQLLARMPELRSAAMVETLYNHILQLARENLRDAAALATCTLQVAEQLGEARAQGLALRAIANIRYLEGQHERAYQHYRQAVDCFRLACGGKGDEEEIARTQSSAIQTLAYLARYDEAIRWGKKARQVFAARKDHLRLARLDGNLANLFFRLDRFEDALASYEKARDAFLVCGAPQDLAAVLSNLATCYISVGRFDDSLAAHRQAREHCAAHGFSLLVAQADYNIAYLHFLRGDYREAMHLYAAARKHSAAAGDFYHATLCDLDQAEMMLDLNLLDEAKRLARQAIRGFHRLGIRYECAKATAFLGMAMAARSEVTQAVRALGRAKRLFTEEGNEVWTAFLDLHLALLDLGVGRLRRARLRAEAAMLRFSHREIPTKTILAELVLVRIHLASGTMEEAEHLCRSALQRAETVDSPSLLFQCRFLLGVILQAIGSRPEALHSLEIARDTLDMLRQGIPEEELRIRFSENRSALFEHLVTLYLGEAGQPASPYAAWTCVQNAKSRVFLDVLAQRSRAFGQAGPSLRTVNHPLAQLRRELQQAYMRAADGELRGNANEASLWRQRVATAELRLKTELAQLRLESGARLELSPGYEHTPADLPCVQSALAPGEALVEYFCTASRVFAFIVNRHRELIVEDLGATVSLRSLVRLALFQISGYHNRRSAGAARERHWPALASHLERLHAALIAPILGHMQAQSLVVAPHGFLHGVPFAALGSSEHPLASAFLLLRSLSASTYAAPLQPRSSKPHRQRAQGGTPRSLVLGVPDQRAPFIAEEVRHVASLLPESELLLDTGATLQALRERGRDARFLHIASHGLFRSDNPMFSAIRLADGNLNLYDLEEMELSAELVTLSGCSTGVHAVIGGDELIGLSRGFFHAGARNLLVSLWDVSDSSTSTFMRHFYSRLASDASLESALCSATLSVREEFPHPYHWAAFSMMRSAVTRPQEASE